MDSTWLLIAAKEDIEINSAQHVRSQVLEHLVRGMSKDFVYLPSRLKKAQFHRLQFNHLDVLLLGLSPQCGKSALVKSMLEKEDFSSEHIPTSSEVSRFDLKLRDGMAQLLDASEGEELDLCVTQGRLCIFLICDPFSDVGKGKQVEQRIARLASLRKKRGIGCALYFKIHYYFADSFFKGITLFWCAQRRI
jgi:hypothetical protein